MAVEIGGVRLSAGQKTPETRGLPSRLAASPAAIEITVVVMCGLKLKLSTRGSRRCRQIGQIRLEGTGNLPKRVAVAAKITGKNSVASGDCGGAVDNPS